MNHKPLAELLAELEHSTIYGKSQVEDISWEQTVELKEFFKRNDACYWSLHKHLGEIDTYTFVLYTV